MTASIAAHAQDQQPWVAPGGAGGPYPPYRPSQTTPPANDPVPGHRHTLPRNNSDAIKHPFRFGPWLVDPAANCIEMAHEKRQMEPRTMAVLLALCKARGGIVSSDDLLTQCWGSTLTGDGALHKNIALLRRILSDSATTPVYIETIRLRGYRAVAPLDFATGPTGAQKSWQGDSPFRGLLPYDEAHADVFFGRDAEIARLADAAVAQVRSGLALLLVHGPSGCGKTSLIQAGLLPALTRREPSGSLHLLASTTYDLGDRGEQTLFTALGGALLDLQWEDQSAFPGQNAVGLGNRLEHHCSAVVAEVTALVQARPDSLFVIFLDSFEALFDATLVTEADRCHFLLTLDQMVRSNAMLLIIACRNDIYPRIARYALLAESQRGHFDLAPPDFGAITQMIRRPAAAACLTFGVDPATHATLDDVLCASAAVNPHALPLLQHCLQEMYQQRTADGVLGRQSFHRRGWLQDAICQCTERVVLRMNGVQRKTLPDVMALVVVPPLNGAPVNTLRVPWSKLPNDAARQAVTALVEARLFLSDLHSETPVFGIAHDALLRCWPSVTT